MKADFDHDVFVFEIHQIRDEFCYLGEVVSTERLSTGITLDTLPAEKYFTMRIQEI